MSAFVRFNSTEPKVQGQVIGIDLGKFLFNKLDFSLGSRLHSNKH